MAAAAESPINPVKDLLTKEICVGDKIFSQAALEEYYRELAEFLKKEIVLMVGEDADGYFGLPDSHPLLKDTREKNDEFKVLLLGFDFDEKYSTKINPAERDLFTKRNTFSSKVSSFTHVHSTLYQIIYRACQLMTNAELVARSWWEFSSTFFVKNMENDSRTFGVFVEQLCQCEQPGLCLPPVATLTKSFAVSPQNQQEGGHEPKANSGAGVVVAHEVPRTSQVQHRNAALILSDIIKELRKPEPSDEQVDAWIQDFMSELVWSSVDIYQMIQVLIKDVVTELSKRDRGQEKAAEILEAISSGAKKKYLAKELRALIATTQNLLDSLRKPSELESQHSGAKAKTVEKKRVRFADPIVTRMVLIPLSPDVLASDEEHEEEGTEQRKDQGGFAFLRQRKVGGGYERLREDSDPQKKSGHPCVIM